MHIWVPEHGNDAERLEYLNKNLMRFILA